MKTFTSFLGVLAVLLLAARLSPLHAQYNPPPPPEQQNTGEAPDQDQGAPPPMDQGQPQPAPDDQNAPPPQDQGAPDQGAPDQGAPPDQADNGSGDANFQTFYDNLSSQGNWVQTNNYGYVWQPNVQDPDWAPYTDGHWVYTDEGWTWVADDSEPWGWATYHYGRWVNIDGQGWAWVPGYTWAPAWVSWRYGGGYCGWAPLPPDTFVGIDFGGVGFGFHIGGDCDTAYGIGPGYYHFIGVGFLGERDYRRHYRDRNDNFTIINNTRNVTNIVVNNQRGAGRFSRVSTGGPNFATINAQSSTPVQRVSLRRSNRVGNASLSGNSLSVFAPHVAAASTGASFRPRSVAGTLSNVRVNNGANISDPLVVNSRVRGRAATSEQITAARAAASHVPSNANIATTNTRPTAALTRPLTSFQPHTEVRSHATTGSAPTLQSNHVGNNASSSAVRPENNFTGEAPVTHNANTENHTFTPNSTVVHHNENNANGANHTFTPGTTLNTHNSVNAENTSNTQMHANSVQPNTGGEVQHHDFAPAEHHDATPPSNFHPQEEHHESAPPQPQVQHNDFHPQAQQHQSAPPQQQHSAPPSHPSGDNHSSGNNNSGGNNGNKH
jgi:hypothetical protein